jgi:predicted CopG family antitoxin
MSRSKKQISKTLSWAFGTTNDREVSKKLVQKLMQYNMKYEEITKVILTHSERAFLDARLITIEEYYRELQDSKQSEIESFLASLPEIKLINAL